MRRRTVLGSIMAALLTGCAATQPRAATTPTAVAVVNEPTATPSSSSESPAPPVAASTAAATAQATTALTATPAAPAASVAAGAAGAVTPSMQQLNIAGARYAALGDPNAPLTIVEYSDFG